MLGWRCHQGAMPMTGCTLSHRVSSLKCPALRADGDAGLRGCVRVRQRRAGPAVRALRAPVRPGAPQHVPPLGRTAVCSPAGCVCARRNTPLPAFNAYWHLRRAYPGFLKDSSYPICYIPT